MRRIHFRKSSYRNSKVKLGILFVCLVFGLTILSLVFPLPAHKAQATDLVIDSSAHTNSDFHNGYSTVVFTNDQTGYAFFVDQDTVAVGDGGCGYRKTTDGGATWGSYMPTDAQPDCFNISVWYDQWTPGDNSGTFIHIATVDDGADDLWYTRLNTSDDGLSTKFSISTDVVNTFNTGAGGSKPTITKGTDGDLYVAIQDDDAGPPAGAYVKKCTTSCHDDTGDDWTTNTPTGLNQAGGDQLGLYPLASAAVMLIRFDNSTDDFEHKIYTDGAPGSWESGWTTIFDNQPNNTNYTNHWGATVDKKTNNIYMAWAKDNSTLGTDDDVKAGFYTTSGTPGWQTAANGVVDDVINQDTRGLTGAKIAFDQNTAAIYVVYTAQPTAGTGNDANIYYKKSTDQMDTWSTESAAINTTARNIYGARVNIMSNERIYVTWVDQNNNDLRGNTVVDLTPPTYDLSAYTFFTNTNSTNVGSRLNYQDTPATLVTDGDAFRLRLLLHVNGDGIRGSFEDFKLQFATRSGSCDTGYSGETYADVTGSTAIAYNNNSNPTDGLNLTNNDFDPTHSSHTIVTQTYEEANNFTNSGFAGASPSFASGFIGGGQDGKWDFALLDNDGTTNGTYCFRVVKSDGSVLNTPIVMPEVTAVAAGPTCSIVLTEHQMRHGNYYCAGAEDKFKWVD